MIKAINILKEIISANTSYISIGNTTLPAGITPEGTYALTPHVDPAYCP